MGELKETFRKNNATTVNLVNNNNNNNLLTTTPIPQTATTGVPPMEEGATVVSPSVVEGFNMYCTMKADGEDYKTVCKKIADGIEAVHETISNPGTNEEAACGT